MVQEKVKELFAKDDANVLRLLEPLDLHGDAHHPVVSLGTTSRSEDH